MRKLLLVIAIALAGVFFAPAPAQAFPSQSVGLFFDGSGGSGASLNVNGTNCYGGGLNLPLNWNDRISSVRGGPCYVQLFKDSNYRGISWTSAPGVTWNVGGGLNNQASSVRFW